MIRAFDHVVILVGELDQAVADYAALGFTVVPGGEHTGGATHNALVAFADGAYLELIAFRRPAPEHQWYRHVAGGEGLIDFALLPGAIEEDIAAARQRGLALDGPTPGGRLRPDGQQIAWQTGRSLTPDLPFLCGDVTPRALRVPEGAAREHPNGVTGIAELLVAVADVDASAARYQALLGAQAETGGLDVSRRSFALGQARITLVADEAAKQRIAVSGEGPLALKLRAPAGALALNPARLHGARIELVS